MCFELNIPTEIVSLPPTISLIGPAKVVLSVGDLYAKCPVPKPLGLVCDEGASGADAIEGDLSDRITVCDGDG